MWLPKYQLPFSFVLSLHANKYPPSPESKNVVNIRKSISNLRYYSKQCFRKCVEDHENEFVSDCSPPKISGSSVIHNLALSNFHRNVGIHNHYPHSLYHKNFYLLSVVSLLTLSIPLPISISTYRHVTMRSLLNQHTLVCYLE